MKIQDIGLVNSINRLKKKSIFNFLLIFLAFLLIIFITVPIFVGSIDTKMEKASYQCEVIIEALEAFNLDWNRYPSNSEGLSLLVSKKNLNGESYLKNLYKDPWNRPYRYLSPGIHNKDSFDLWTYGADDKLGGKGANKDITNWIK
jgi:general secretion pathway protein G